MQLDKKVSVNKGKISSIALILVLAMSLFLILLPSSSAQSPGEKNTFPIIGAVPNPAGVGQEVLITTGLTHATAWPQPGWYDITVTVERPDGEVETLGPVTTDTTGLTGMVYYPPMTGTYYLQTHFPEQVIEVTAAGTPAGTLMLASSSEKLELVVEEEKAHTHPGFARPAEYWTRPIDAQLREWYSVSANWLNMPTYLRVAPYNEDAPETAHILWTRPYADGGLVGGDFGGLSYEHGDAYEGKWSNPVILNGVLFYNQHASQTHMPAFDSVPVEQRVVAVDLKTGEERWNKVLGDNERLAFGQVMHWSTMNMHGAFSYLWTTVGSTWNAYDPFTGRWDFSISNVPGGTNVVGPSGEILRYSVNTGAGTMSMWNSTSVVWRTYVDYYLADPATADLTYYYAGRWRPHGITFDGSVGVDWTVDIEQGLPGSALLFLEDRVIGTNTQWSGGAAVQDPQFWAIGIAPDNRGELLFHKHWDIPIPDVHVDIPRSLMSQDLPDGVFVVTLKETRQHYGFSTETGEELWGPTEMEHWLHAYSNVYFGMWGQAVIADGKLFTSGMGGIVNAYDVLTGAHLWEREVDDPYTEQLFGNNWPGPIAFVTDGKLYFAHMEHSVIDPRPRGGPFLALDVDTGEVVFKMEGLRIGTRWGGQPIIADSVIVGLNTYDNQLVALGRGPSAISVSAPDVAVDVGRCVLINGMVRDVSPGTEDYGIRARFPNGVPAVADEFMSEWMAYVYGQFSRPADVAGVQVTLTVVDPNGGVQTLTTASDSYGRYSYPFSADVEGLYYVTAEFEGSKAYWPSKDTTCFVIGGAVAPEPTPPNDVPPPDAPVPINWYIIIAAVVVVAVVAVAAIFLKKRK